MTAQTAPANLLCNGRPLAVTSTRSATRIFWGVCNIRLRKQSCGATPSAPGSFASPAFQTTRVESELSPGADGIALCCSELASSRAEPLFRRREGSPTHKSEARRSLSRLKCAASRDDARDGRYPKFKLIHD